MRNSIHRIARYIYARALYITMSRQISTLVLHHRMKEAHRVSRYRRRLGAVLFDK